MEERDTYGKAFLQIENLWVRDEAVRHFTLARRFGQIAADLLGVDGVRIYHDQALFKEPGGGPTPWHQDQHYWPLDTDNTVTLWMPLVDIPAQIGSMTLRLRLAAAGLCGRSRRSSDKSDQVLSEFIQEKGLQKTHYGAMSAGDATFHAGWTLHSAPGNPTAAMREVMTIIYYADGTHLLGPENPRGRNDMGWFPGLAPGDLAASELNPLVYSK